RRRLTLPSSFQLATARTPPSQLTPRFGCEPWASDDDGDAMNDEMLPQGGRRVSRRTVLASAGTLGLGVLAAACSRGLVTAPGSAGTTTSGASIGGAAPSCVLTPELTKGPFYLPL